MKYKDFKKNRSQFGGSSMRFENLSKDQKEFIISARKEPVVSSDNMVELWEKFGWGTINKSTILKYHRRLIKK